MAQGGEEIWTAPANRLAAANITAFLGWLRERDHSFEGYQDLWEWSVADLEGFWRAIWDYFDVIHEGEIDRVMTDDPMPRTRWFTGTRANYAENVLRLERVGDPNRPMMLHASELRDLQSTSWADVGDAVRTLATKLREMGLGPGCQVVAYMPNIPETVIAMLATTAIGATWSSAAPEFGVQTVIDRFSQIEPTLVFATNGYRYGGKDFDRTDDLKKIMRALPSVTHLVMLDYQPSAGTSAEFAGTTVTWDEMLSGDPIPPEDFRYERVPSDHPLWVLFSSGTTGLPKPIVHGHHGIIVEHYKSAAFHFEIPKDGALFFFSTTGWMVWNTLMWGPLLDARTVLYDGHPAYPDAGLLWRIADDARVTTLGVSPTYLQIVRQQGIEPAKSCGLEDLQSVMLVGSPATPEIFDWVHETVKPDVWATSQSGGTEFCSGILAGSLLLPTRAGEIQAPGLGTAAYAFDAKGNPVIGEEGELVVTKPMPSMPIFFWNDRNMARYQASYFDTYPGVWCHGDRVLFTDHGGSFVLGRSDATLNRFGVRIGSAEIYRTMEKFPEIADSLIVCVQDPGGEYYMPLFVKLTDGAVLDEALKAKITHRLRTERSPRHVPDVIVEAPDIPMTLTGKKMEVPIRKLLLGQTLSTVASKDASRNPEALEWFAAFARDRVAS